MVTLYLSHILLQYARFCMSNNSICPRIQLPVSAQWSQRLYVKVQGKTMHKDMHKIVFQSNEHISTYRNKV
jgi:hypothetical protein